GDLLERVLVVPGVLQRHQQSLHAGDVSYRRGHRRPVEVGAQGHAVDAELVDEVVDVPDHDLERQLGVGGAVGGQEAGVEVEAHQPLRAGDGRELRVGEVAGRGADRVRVRVRGDERRLREVGHVPEAALADVREVEHDPELVAALDQPHPVGGETRGDVGRGGE